ncbi:Mur ligase family protein [Niallia oryzisoli]|uniref:Mur ligase family protein n=1 Tax=Niallia oryzisoli TaxID=1737571 RepID=A0ABZ2CBQ4_9BACI
MQTIIFIGTYMSGSSRDGMRAAKELGYYNILFTATKLYQRMRGEFTEVDELIYLEDMSLANLYNQCKAIQEKGFEIRLCMSYIDPYISKAAKLSEQLNLTQASTEALAKIENKANVRDILRDHPSTPFFKVYTGKEPIERGLQEYSEHLPLVLKYPDSNGSKNVYFVDSEEKFKNRLKDMRSKRRKPVLIEEYVTGTQYIIEVLVYKEKVTIAGVIEQEINEHLVVTGYSYPAVLEKEEQWKLQESVKSIITNLGLQTGSCHLEMRWRNGEWKLIEVNPRMSGRAVNDIIKEGTGIDLAKETLKLYLGEEPEAEFKSKKYVFAQYVTVNQKGRLIKVTGQEQASNRKGVTKVSVIPRKGDVLRPPTVMGFRYAYVIAASDNPDQSKAIAKQAAQEIKFHLQPIGYNEILPKETAKEHLEFLPSSLTKLNGGRTSFMKNLYLSQIIPIINGSIISQIENDPLIQHVSFWNYNPITTGTLVFFPNKSRLERNLNLKSSVIVTQNPLLFQDLNKSYTIVAVKNSKVAFEKFIKFYRSLFSIPVIGITGTAGKTTTKDLVAHILGADWNVVKTIRSQNGGYQNLRNLLQVNDQTDAAVFEFGVGARGVMDYFCRIFQPSIGVITNIATDHGSGFKSQQDYTNEKAKLAAIINKNNGTLILNSDDQNIQNLDLGYFEGQIITFGLSNHAQFKADHIRYTENGMEFSVPYGNEVYECRINAFGKHNVYNVLAAFAVCKSLGLQLKDMVKRLESFHLLERHLEIRKGINNCTLIDDTWNTNSISAEAALEVLANLSKGRKTIAVLGDVEELGHFSESEHKKIGTFVHKYKVHTLVTVGKQAKYIAQQARSLGMDDRNIFMLENKEGLVSLLENISDSNSILLVKASMRDSFGDTMNKLIAE